MKPIKFYDIQTKTKPKHIFSGVEKFLFVASYPDKSRNLQYRILITLFQETCGTKSSRQMKSFVRDGFNFALMEMHVAFVLRCFPALFSLEKRRHLELSHSGWRTFKLSEFSPILNLTNTFRWIRPFRLLWSPFANRFESLVGFFVWWIKP